MTTEQWAVYLWAIWPDDGIRFLVSLADLAVGLYWLAFLLNTKGRNQKYWEEFKPSDFDEFKYIVRKDHALIFFELTKNLKMRLVTTVALALTVILYFVPTRNEMVAILIAPYVISNGKESLENGKLEKLNRLLNISLDKIIKEVKNEM